MKEIPILFSTPMVQAELDGRKTNTRRLKNLEVINENPDKWSFQEKFTHVGKYERDKHAYRFVDGEGSFMDILCPFGRPGDLLWVRENWQLKGWDFEEGTMTVKYATGETYKCLAHDPDEDSSWLMDKVDWLEDHGYIKPDPTNEEMFVFTDKKQPYKPSIHMPKEAARIWLQVESVRVERLQDISEQDAIAEGIEKKPGSSSSTMFDYKHYGYDHSYDVEAKASFRTLWDSINGPDSWPANPWLWVISFRVLSTTGKPDKI